MNFNEAGKGSGWVLALFRRLGRSVTSPVTSPCENRNDESYPAPGAVVAGPRSTPRGSRTPSTVEFFNRIVGGSGRLHADPEVDGGYAFFGPENWVGRVLRKRGE